MLIFYNMAPKRPLSHSERLRKFKKPNDRKHVSQLYELKRKSSIAKKIRSSSRWRKMRELTLKKNPLCADPFGHHEYDKAPQIASQVHHVVPLFKSPELAYVASNLAPICTRCHAKIEGMERAGKATVELFKDKTSPPMVD